MALKIQVLDIREVKNNALKAVAKLKIEDFFMVINDVKLFVKGDHYWAQMPSMSYEKDGEKKYFPYIQFTNKDIEKEILNTAAHLMLKEYEEAKSRQSCVI